MSKLKIDGAVYDIPEDFTLGDLRTFKRFGVVDPSQAAPTDPDMIAALIFIAMRRVNPHVTEEVVDTVQMVEFLDDEPDVEEPTPPPVAAAGNGAATSSSTVTIRASSGSPS